MEHRNNRRVNVVAWATIFLSVFAIFASAQQDGDVRLVGGDVKNEGRVEVYYGGQWGTVCDDSWHNIDADVVCKQLGFEAAEQIFYRAQYGEGTGPIWIDQINCTGGASSILDCDHNKWGTHDCTHREDAAVICKRIAPDKPAEMPVRLSCPGHIQDGLCKACSNKKRLDPGECLPQAAIQGVVEVYYDGKWKPLSLEGWNTKSAQVVCNELGYPEAYGSPALSKLWTNWDGSYCDNENISCTPEEVQANDIFRERLTSTWLKELDCSGGEGKLLNCYFREFGPNNSSDLQVATVICGFRLHPDCFVPGSIKETYRTRGSPVSWSGRLEVLVNGEWGTICDRTFGLEEAHIACRALGYGSAKTVHRQATYGRGIGKIHYYSSCKGTEYYLADCSKASVHSCDHGDDVSVVCNIPTPCDAEKDKVSRLVPVPNPQYPNHTNDFVEVKGPYGWGLLCADSLDTNSAYVVCKENKNLFSQRIRSGSHADYDGVRYKGTVECSGDEDGMNMCSVFVVKVESCPKGDAIVDCTENLPDLVPSLRRFQESLVYTPYISRNAMYYLTCALEENCLSSSARGQPYNHYRNLLKFNSQTDNWGTVDFRPILDRSQWLWHSCHNHYHSFEAFIHYDLLNKTTGEKVAEGHKASFCLEDTACAEGTSRNYRCGTGEQGISKNCGDLYGRHLDCQWIDITDVPPGTYQLRQHVNPDKLSAESDYGNNIISCDITFSSGTTRFAVENFKLSDH